MDTDAGYMGSASILASTIAVGVGTAWGAVMQGQDRVVVVVYFGDAAGESGAFHEAMNFAAMKKLPVIFVCENNLYSVHSPLSVRQPHGRSISSLELAHDVEGLHADGNDVEEVWRLGKYVVRKAHAGEGPSLLEFQTYRWKEHSGPSDDWQLGYRSLEELTEWQERCPVTCYRRALVADGALSETEANEMTAEYRQEANEAVRFAKESPFPTPEQLYQGVFPTGSLR